MLAPQNRILHIDLLLSIAFRYQERTLKIEVVVDLARAASPPSLAQRVGDVKDVRMSESRCVQLVKMVNISLNHNTRPPRARGERGGERRGGRGGGRGGDRKANERPKRTAEDLDAEMAVSKLSLPIVLLMLT